MVSFIPNKPWKRLFCCAAATGLPVTKHKKKTASNQSSAMSEVFAHAIYFLCQIYNPRYSNSANLLAVMRPGKIDNWPERHDPSGINFLVGHVVVTLDVIDADRLGDSGLLVKVE